MNSIRINRVRAMSEEFARDKGGIAAYVWRYCTSGTDGVLTKERMAWLTRIMRDAKRVGTSLDGFLSAGGGDRRSVEFCRFIWARL